MHRLNSSGSYVLTLLFISILCVFSLQNFPAHGAQKSDGLQEVNTSVEVDQVVIKAVLEDPGSETFASGENGQDVVMLDGLRLSGRPGEPMLPVRIFDFLMPPGADLSRLSVSVQKPYYRQIQGEYDIMAAPPTVYREENRDIITWGGKNPSVIENSRDQIIYGSNSYYPDSIVTISGSGRLRNLQIVKVKLSVARYNPVEKRVEVLTDGVIQIKAPMAHVSSETKTKMEFTGHPSQFASQLQTLVNPDDIVEFYGYKSGVEKSSVLNPIKMVIITTEEILRNTSALPNYVSYKRSRGYEVRVVTEGSEEDDDHYQSAGTSQQRALNIRSWLQDREDDLHAALLIGDPRENPLNPRISVPMMYCYPFNGNSPVPVKDDGSYVDVPTDMFYADLSGTWDWDNDGFYGEFSGDYGAFGFGADAFAELDIGRVPFYGNNGDDYSVLNEILNRFISFEDTYEGDIGYRNNVLIAAAISNFAPTDNNSDGDSDDAWEYPSRNWKTYGDSWGEGIKTVAGLVGSTAYTLYEKEGGVDFPTTPCDAALTKTNLVDAWQSGYGYTTWFAHGGSGSASRRIWDSDSLPSNGICNTDTEQHDTPFFEHFDAASLNNAYPGFSVNISCLNGNPDATHNLGTRLLEEWGVGTVTASRISGYLLGTWEASWAGNGMNQDIGHRMYSQLAQDNNTLARSLNLTRYETDYSQYESGAWNNALAYNMYGDPTLRLSSSRLLYYPTITVSSPNGYEDYKIGEFIPVTWSSTAISGNVAIDISRDGGGSWSTVVSGTQNDGHHNISLSSPENAKCRIRIRSTDGSHAEDISNYYFTLSNPPVPGTPTGLVATNGSFTDRVRLTWNPVSYAQHYKVYRGVDGGIYYSLLSNAFTSEYDDTTASSLTTYRYYVVAVNSVGDASSSSETDTGFVTSTLTLPSIPTGVSASDGSFADKVRVLWDSSAGASLYKIQRALVTGGISIYTEIGTSTATYYYDDTAEQDNVYNYRIVATNPLFESGPSTADSGFVTLGINLPAIPTGVTASDGDFTDKVQLSWEVAANAVGYKVYKAPVTGGLTAYQLIENTISTTFEDSEVTPGAHYSYKISSYGILLDSDLSVSDTGFAAGVSPGVPTDLAASNGLYSDHISVSWQPVDNALYYHVYRGVVNDEGIILYMEIADIAGTTLDDYDILPDFLYIYKVKAVNQFGDSGFSNTDTGYPIGKMMVLPPILMLLLE